MGGRVTEVVGSYEEILFVVNAITAFLDAGFDSPDAAGAPCAFPGDAVG